MEKKEIIKQYHRNNSKTSFTNYVFKEVKTMTPMDWFGVGYIIVSVIVIIIYLGLYFGWF